jgi:hypothetical protein
VDPNSFFSDSDPYAYILTRNFLKWCLSLLSYVFWNLYDREKSFPTEKRTFFSFLSVWFAIFRNTFYFKTVPGSESESIFRIRIQPKYSDSFEFGSITLNRRVFCENYPYLVDRWDVDPVIVPRLLLNLIGLTTTLFVIGGFFRLIYRTLWTDET